MRQKLGFALLGGITLAVIGAVFIDAIVGGLVGAFVGAALGYAHGMLRNA